MGEKGVLDGSESDVFEEFLGSHKDHDCSCWQTFSSWNREIEDDRGSIRS